MASSRLLTNVPAAPDASASCGKRRDCEASRRVIGHEDRFARSKYRWWGADLPAHGAHCINICSHLHPKAGSGFGQCGTSLDLARLRAPVPAMRPAIAALFPGTFTAWLTHSLRTELGSCRLQVEFVFGFPVAQSGAAMRSGRGSMLRWGCPGRLKPARACSHNF